jgi:hypothetical protein
MTSPLGSLLGDWKEFYTLVGTASAALVALLFVAASIGAGFITAERAGGLRTYMSPVVAHFTAVLFTCVVALAPTHTRLSLTLVIGATSLAGLVYAIMILVRLLRHTKDLPDRLCYGVSPLVGYAIGLGAAWLFGSGYLHAPEVLAAALVVLLIVNIRNAWDLTISMARATTSRLNQERAASANPPVTDQPPQGAS